MDVVHDVKKDTCKCARPGFTPLEDLIHYGAHGNTAILLWDG